MVGKQIKSLQQKLLDNVEEMSPSEIMQDELEPIIHKPKIKMPDHVKDFKTSSKPNEESQ